MDPWTISAIIGAANGLVGIGNSRNLQEKQQALQVAAMRSQMAESARLQKELRLLASAEAAEARRETFRQQERMAAEARVAATWPFKTLAVDHFVSKFRRYADAGDDIPLQLIVAHSATMKVSSIDLAAIFKGAVSDLINYMSQHFSMNNNDASVEVYTADHVLTLNEIRTIHDLMSGAPTIILQPRCDNGCYILELAMWGIGSVQEIHSHEVYRCDLKTLYYEVMEKALNRWQIVKASGAVSPNEQWDALRILFEEEKERVDSARNSGVTEAEIDRYIRSEFLGKYDAYAKLLASDAFEAYRDMVRSSCKVICTLIADSYYLVQKGRKPQFPVLCRQELEASPVLLDASRQFFNSMLQMVDSPYRIPLLQSRLAASYESGGFESLSSELRGESEGLICKYIPDDNRSEWLLLDDLTDTVVDLSRSPNCSRHVRACYERLLNQSADADFMNAVNCYEKKEYDAAFMWMQRAAERGVAVAFYNLGIFFNKGIGVSANQEKAVNCWLRSIEGKCEAAYVCAYAVAEALLEARRLADLVRMLSGLLHDEVFLQKKQYSLSCLALKVVGMCLLMSQARQSLSYMEVESLCKACGLSDSSASSVMSALKDEINKGNIYAIDAYVVISLVYYKGENLSLLVSAPYLQLSQSVVLPADARESELQYCNELKDYCEKYNSPHGELLAKIQI